MTVPPNSTAQTATTLPHPQTGEPIRTIKVCQGQSLYLNVKVEGAGGQTAPFRWLRNGEELPGSNNQTQLPINAVDLSHQAVYQAVAISPCGVSAFSERIFLDVVVPPAATLNTATLHLPPRASGYFEVIPDAAQLAEMDTLTFTWDRAGHVTFLSGRVQAFVFSELQTAEDATAVDGRYTCTVANLCGAIQLTGDLVAGPRILVAAAAPANAPAGGPPAVLTVTATGAFRIGQSHRRPDFPRYENFGWGNDSLPGIISVTWRHRGMPIVPNERFAMATDPFAGTGTLTIHQPDYEDEGEYDCIVTDSWGETRAVLSPTTRLLLHPLAPPYLTVVQGGPDPRTGGGMVYDARRGRAVLFGGTAFGNNPRSPAAPAGFYASNETWEWDGQLWVKRSPANRPPPLVDFGMAYDAARGRTVVFGGAEFQPPAYAIGTQVLTNAVWEWDGEDWQKAAPLTSPTARSQPRLAYDTMRQETLLLGGDRFPNGVADWQAERHQLWAWNGKFWTARPSLPTAGGTYFYPRNALVFDEARGTAVIFGVFSDAANPVWEWNGASWTRVVPSGELRITDRGSGNSAAFYDPVRRMTGLAVVGNNFADGLGYVHGTPFVAWWDGSRFVRGETGLFNDVDGRLPGLWEMIPYTDHGDLEVFDTARRCHVWLDMPQSAPTGPAYTREMHFSAKVKLAHLPRPVVLTPGQELRLLAVSAGQRPLTYQWFKDGEPLADDARRTGVDTPQLVITNALPSDAGLYRVRIANDHQPTGLGRDPGERTRGRPRPDAGQRLGGGSARPFAVLERRRCRAGTSARSDRSLDDGRRRQQSLCAGRDRRRRVLPSAGALTRERAKGSVPHFPISRTTKSVAGTRRPTSVGSTLPSGLTSAASLAGTPCWALGARRTPECPPYLGAVAERAAISPASAYARPHHRLSGARQRIPGNARPDGCAPREPTSKYHA